MNKEVKCRYCGKGGKNIKYYIIADDLEKPKPYHPACIKKLNFEIMLKLSDINMPNL